MLRTPFSLMALTSLLLAAPLVGCGSSDDGDSSSAEATGDSTAETTTATTTGDGDGDSTTTATGDGDGDSTTTSGDGDGDSTTTSTTGDGDGDGDGDALCGNGTVEGDEVCDDGNNVTEFPVGANDTYAATDCMSDCSMLLATCGDANADPGEACDDGNGDSTDNCTTSCNLNTSGVHSACDRSTGASDQNVNSGTITNCGSVSPQANMETGCVLSSNFFNQTYVFAAEGDCQMMALKCDGLSCSLGGVNDVGNYDAVTSCPAGTVLIDKIIMAGGLVPMISSKVCQVTCDSDADCRWNARDAYSNDGWNTNGGTPYGQFRCATTPLSGGAKICGDARNNAI